ncbi:hypothetical protein [uncultured Pseudodesulfovibrio sp.]|uniref:hypothetical protein n=1 Tax=uncultured Pseudodesulfovibrio sp. TaxID=2035858 RepID=UPI0037494BCA
MEVLIQYESGLFFEISWEYSKVVAMRVEQSVFITVRNQRVMTMMGVYKTTLYLLWTGGAGGLRVKNK